MTDLIERLRNFEGSDALGNGDFSLLHEAADALEAARGMVDGCHCATCTCNPGMTPAIRFDTSPAAQEGAVRDRLIALGWTPPGSQQPAVHPAITHCDNCGCDWLDNGLNPVGCPYCKQSTEVEALREEVERLRKMHQDAYQRGLQAGSRGLREMYDAIQAVKRQDAWDNARLTEALMEAEERAERAEAENKRLREELSKMRGAEPSNEEINAAIGKYFQLPGNACRAHATIAEVLRAQPAASAEPVAAQAPRPCTCHPDDRPDGPCREKYASNECLAAAVERDAPEVAL